MIICFPICIVSYSHLLLPLAVVHEPFRSLRVGVEYDILNAPEQFRIDLVVYLKHGGIDDSHIQTCLYCMVKES